MTDPNKRWSGRLPFSLENYHSSNCRVWISRIDINTVVQTASYYSEGLFQRDRKVYPRNNGKDIEKNTQMLFIKKKIF